MRVFVVLALLSLIWSGDAEENYIIQTTQPQAAFGFPDFNINRKPELNFGGNARLGNSSIRNNAVELTPGADNYENTMGNPDGEIKGSVFYKEPVHLINRYTTAAFRSVFAFSMKPVYPSNTGDGITFVITSHPSGTGDADGNFGFFHHGKKKRTTLAIEFDTYKNHELLDIDNNHVGVDFGEPISSAAVSAHSVGITLNGGNPVTAWVEYNALLQRLEVRVQIGLSNYSRPEKHLIAIPLALKQVMEEDMWVGFSAATQFGQNQKHYLYSWSFSADYIMPEHSHGFLKKKWKIILIAVLCGSFLILSICFVLFRFCRNPRSKEEDIIHKEMPWGGKPGNILLERNDIDSQEMPKASQAVESDADDDAPGVKIKCLPFEGKQSEEDEVEEVRSVRRWLPRILSSSPAGSRDGDSPRSNYRLEDDTIMYSNSMYTSDDDSQDLIPAFPYDAYPDERIDSIASSKPKPYSSPIPQYRSHLRSTSPSPRRTR
ncbi:hypothetical protein R1flu_004802 [Riccia fluitans]|uniref:Legume lectin domain-containing protein n=1 Tax=Riccia fluitans TaxID=41844 RepID=A0ABD1YRY6_9MARC